MEFRLKKTITRVTMLTALVPTLSLLAADALAHKPVPPSPKRDPATSAQRGDYAYDAYGRNVRSGYGECVVDGWWTPATATLECHPDMFAEPAPRAAAPEPKPEPKAVEAPPAPIAYEADKPDVYAQQAAAEEEFKGVPAPAEEERDLGPDFYAPGDDPNLVPVPLADAGEEADDKLGQPRMFYDEEEGVAADDGILARSQYYEEEEGVAQDDGILAQSQYYDEEELTSGDDGILAYRREFDEEEGVAQDDGILARSEYHEEEEGAERDDGILARSEYHEEEEGAERDEGILARSEYHEEEEGVERDDGILARNQYYEEEEGAAPEESIVGRSQYYEEEGKEAAEAIGAPKTFQEEQVAAAEEKAPEAKPEPTPEAKPEPTPEAKPKPEPKPVVLPITITVEADALFDFDRSNVRSDARAKLDKLVDDLQGVNYEEILVVGHADRIGTLKYNQRLSERRANAVKNYLVGKGLPADKIKTDARGELEPETTPEQCEGQRKSKLIACLQPDRRAEVTVTGQK
jgi:OOP family OmpA-OmpF porin